MEKYLEIKDYNKLPEKEKEKYYYCIHCKEYALRELFVDSDMCEYCADQNKTRPEEVNFKYV